MTQNRLEKNKASENGELWSGQFALRLTFFTQDTVFTRELGGKKMSSMKEPAALAISVPIQFSDIKNPIETVSQFKVPTSMKPVLQGIITPPQEFS